MIGLAIIIPKVWIYLSKKFNSGEFIIICKLFNINLACIIGNKAN